jgi:hypothetical protein
MQIFLSHAAEDARVAGSLKQLIERCSFNRMSVWFSSDVSPTGGVTPGGPWFDQLIDRINSSVAFLALITPSSATNLWLHYEAGCAAVRKLPILPLVAGVSVNEVRPPLSLYNAYNVAQPESLKTFVARLYEVNGVQHDDAMLETPIQQTVRDIASALESVANAETENDGDKVIRFIDKRFMDIIDLLPARAQAKMPTFNVQAKVTKNGKTLKRLSLDISDDETIQDVANALYFAIERFVEPYKYLEQWIVRDNTLGVNLIMRDFLDHVKANAVLRPGHEYEIILISQPYDPSKGDFQSLT